ncbi:MAG: DUF924 domain-containing protein [Gammaproteobacteria bacterium]|nr:DUF924 domain-containing protein [Gammaproteobacteria bacterium]MBQ0774093.1 DUF924 domain-containing protein [Gammaproteobacteria bacterium]
MQFTSEKLWQPVLDFWFEDGIELGWPSHNMGELWFGGRPGLDEQIREQFEPLVEAALWSELVEWEEKPLSRVALLVLLDQFTRNIYRGEGRAFSGDHRAVTLVMEGVARGMDELLPWVARVFFYMPLMHAEDLALQDESVSCFTRLVAAAEKDGAKTIADKMRGNLGHAIEHREVIVRFGRFPHRNAALGRESTEEELEYLTTSGRYGQ